MGLLSQIYELRWLLGLVAFAVYLASKVRTYYRLRAFKGPFGTGFSEVWHSLAILSNKSHIKYQQVCDKYGSIARIGPNDLITSSPELLMHMSSVRSQYTRGTWLYPSASLLPGHDNVFSTLDEEKHVKRRRQLGPGYSGKENLELEGSIDTHITELVDLIRSKYLSTDKQSRPMDLALKIQYMTIDLITAIGFGEPLGDVRADGDVNQLIETFGIGQPFMTVMTAFGLTNLVRSVFFARLLGGSETDSLGMGKIVGGARAIIHERLTRDTEKRSDMLASFARRGLSEVELLSEATLQLLAGSDTTATALRSILLYVFTNPGVYTRLQAEVDAAAASRTSQGLTGVISDSELRGLPYLQAVIREGTRIHPPATEALPKRVPKDGDTVTIEGREVFLPGGTNVSCAFWALVRRRDVFGTDACVFRPERWLNETDEGRLAAMNRTYDLIFGHGRYQCLGKVVSQMEMGKTVFELMHSFNWCLTSPESPWREKNYMGNFIQSDMWVLAKDRHSSATGLL